MFYTEVFYNLTPVHIIHFLLSFLLLSVLTLIDLEETVSVRKTLMDNSLY